MSNSKHTPGPWRFGELSETVIGPRGLTICSLPSRYDVEWADRGAVDDDSEIRANARLISTAPDLLKELRYAVESAEHMEGCAWFDVYPPCGVDDPSHRCDCWKASARFAIAKAEK